MTQMKTTLNNNSVPAYIKSVADDQKRKDCNTLVKLMTELTGSKPKMWGDAIIGFDSYHYKYDSGREGDMALVCFSPRVSSLTIYLAGLRDSADLLKKLGKHKVSGGCLHIKKLEDVDMKVLTTLIKNSMKITREKHK